MKGCTDIEGVEALGEPDDACCAKEAKIVMAWPTSRYAVVFPLLLELVFEFSLCDEPEEDDDDEEEEGEDG